MNLHVSAQVEGVDAGFDLWAQGSVTHEDAAGCWIAVDDGAKDLEVKQRIFLRLAVGQGEDDGGGRPHQATTNPMMVTGGGGIQ